MRLGRSFVTSCAAGLGAFTLIAAGLAVPAGAAAAAPAPAAAAPTAEDLLLPNFDVRDGMKPDQGATPATARLERSLGSEGAVDVDPQTGTVDFVRRTDGYLTAPSDAAPADIVRGYLRDHTAAFGLTAGDLATVGAAEQYTSTDGVTHVTVPQVIGGIESYDTLLMGNVDAKGRLINVTAAPAADLSPNTLTPTLTSEDALRAARADVGGDDVVPAVAKRTAGATRAVRFASQTESARLVVFVQPGGDRLAWDVDVLDAHSLLYRVAVDAVTGAPLARMSRTAFDSNDAQVWGNFPSVLQTPTTVNFGTDPTWLDRSAANSNQLIGNNAHAYHDDNGTNGYQAGEEVVRNPGTTTWTYPYSWFAQSECPAFRCTWDSTNVATKATNRSAGTVGMFYLANHFHDHLLSAPIGFDEASRNFEQVNSSGQGVGGDAVLAEAQDSSGTNNANFATPADGSPGRMQMYVWSGSGPASVGPQYDVDGSAAADVVYHEYTHGLSNRLVGNGGGLGALQSGAMGEGWSDFYALDLLVAEGQDVDTASDGEVWMGEYATGVPGIFGGISRIRHQAIDCAVGASASVCPASGTAGSGGYTYGDLGKVGTTNGVHDGGEIWSQTMWDLRKTLGRTDALKVVTGGMRLSPNNPSMLTMRDSIVQAATANGISAVTVWGVFAARGMGYFATTASSSANAATEDFSLPPDLLHVSTVVDDAAPRGDGDGQAEPGETLFVRTTLQNLTASPIPGITGSMAADSGAVVNRAASTWPTIDSSASVANDPAFAVTVPDLQPCGTSINLTVSASAPSGPVTIPVTQVPVPGTPSYTASDDVLLPRAIPDNFPAGVASTFNFPTDGTVTDLNVKIGQLTHSWVGDLKITLTHGATTVVLANRPGAGTNGSSGDNFTDVVLDDEATAPIEGIGNTPNGFTGSYKPDEALSAFDGQPFAGAWTLTVSDNASTDTGSLQSWSLSPVTNCPAPFGTPAVTTDAATGTTTTGAALAGTFDAKGRATDYRFEWGTTAAYGEVTPVTAGGSADGPLPVTEPLTGLTPSTDYHYRLLALRDGIVLATGADQTLRTADVPPEVVTTAATAVGQTAVMVHGTVDPNGIATSYRFDFGTTAAYGSSTTVGNAGSGPDPVTVDGELDVLLPSTDYHFRVVALRADVVLATGGDLTFRTTDLSPLAVTSPATGLAQTAATLNASIDANNVATSYRFEYGTTVAYGSTTALTAAGSGADPLPVSAALTGLLASTDYHFRVVALRNGIVLATGADQAFRTTAYVLPSAPRSVKARPANRAAVVTWVAPLSSGTLPIIGYKVTAQPGGKSCTTTGARQCTVSGLTNGVTYRFVVRARSLAGAGALSLRSPAIIAGAPTAPTRLAVTFPAAAQAKATWYAPGSRGSGPIKGYQVRWSSNGGRTWTTWKGTGLTRSALRSGLVKGHKYVFAVRAFNASGAGPIALLGFTQRK